MTHVAIHDALNAIDRRSQPYAFAGRARRAASVDAAVAAAARGVMVPVLNQQTPPFDGCSAAAVATVEADYAEAVGAIPEGRAKTRGIAVGEAAAAAIVALRAGDGADTPLLVPGYQQGSEPGEYRFTPGTPFAFAPGWCEVTPFVLRDASQFRPGPPNKVIGRRYAADFNEVTAPRHRFVRHQVPLPLLAPGHRDPRRGDRREPGHGSGPRLDAAGADPRDPRLATAATQRLRCAASGAFPRPRRRTGSRASSSASTSAQAVEEGIEHGRKIGDRAVARFMRPVHR